MYVCVRTRESVFSYVCTCMPLDIYIHVQTSLALANTVYQRNRLKNQTQNYVERDTGKREEKTRKKKKTGL